MPKYTDDDQRVALWLATRVLPVHLLQGDAIKSELPYLTGLLSNLRRVGNPPSNWYGITTLTTESLENDKDYMAYLREYEPVRYEAKRTEALPADAYVNAVQSLCRRWRLADRYGPYVVHTVVESSLIYGGKRVRGGMFSTQPTRVELIVSIDPIATYGTRERERDDIDFLRNVIRPFQGDDPLPLVTWHDREGKPGEPGASVIALNVRNLADLQKYFNSVLEAISVHTGLPLRRTRKDAHVNAARNARWFYLNHCEDRSVAQIANAEDGDAVDESVIYKGIEKVRLLLANPDLRLS